MLRRVLLVRFLCLILLRMSCGRSLSVLRILPTGMCFFPALYSMLVNVLSCLSVVVVRRRRLLCLV